MIKLTMPSEQNFIFFTHVGILYICHCHLTQNGLHQVPLSSQIKNLIESIQ